MEDDSQLLSAVLSRNSDEARTLLARGVSPNFRDPDDRLQRVGCANYGLGWVVTFFVAFRVALLDMVHAAAGLVCATTSCRKLFVRGQPWDGGVERVV